jgi:hypothetical protein
MSDLTIKHRAAAVRKSWSYAEHLERALAAETRCRRLFASLGLTPPTQQLAFAQARSARQGRRTG